MSALLEVSGLTIQARTAEGVKTLVDEVSFSVGKTETLGVIGESGSGKTTIARSIIGLLHHNLQISSGTIVVNGKTIFRAGDRDDRVALRGRTVGIVFQSTVDSLDPLMRIGRQLVEIARVHRPQLSRRAAAERAREILQQLKLRDPDEVMRSYPHELSGGMKQRVGIAAAIIAEPELLIADEATSALDLSTQAEVVRLLEGLQDTLGLGMVFVTHDLNLAGDISDQLLVMSNGRALETGPADEVLSRPQDPYTVELLSARPSW